PPRAPAPPLFPYTTLFRSLAAAAATFLAGAAHSAFPERPVSIVVPFPAGGTPDIIARVLADKARDHLGEAVIVENRAGAGGNIRSEEHTSELQSREKLVCR